MSTFTTPAMGTVEPGRLTVFAVCLQTLVILYVTIGWLGQTRLGLLIYLVVLPLIMLQWLFNWGRSIAGNAEAPLRVGLWRDPLNDIEGGLSQAIFRKLLGVQRNRASIHLVLSAVMLPLWIEAFFHMILIPTRI